MTSTARSSTFPLQGVFNSSSFFSASFIHLYATFLSIQFSTLYSAPQSIFSRLGGNCINLSSLPKSQTTVGEFSRDRILLTLTCLSPRLSSLMGSPLTMSQTTKYPCKRPDKVRRKINSDEKNYTDCPKKTYKRTVTFSINIFQNCELI